MMSVTDAPHDSLRSSENRFQKQFIATTVKKFALGTL